MPTKVNKNSTCSRLILSNCRSSKAGVNLYLSSLFSRFIRWINPISHYYPDVAELICQCYNILHSKKVL